MNTQPISLEVRVDSIESGFSDFRAYCNNNFEYIHSSLDELNLSVYRIERNMVTKDDLRLELSGHANKEDLRIELSSFTTKEDLLSVETAIYASFEDLRMELSSFVTKEDLHDVETAIYASFEALRKEVNELRSEVSSMSGLLLRIADKIGVK